MKHLILTIILSLFTIFLFSQNKVQLLIINKIEIIKNIEAESYIKYVTIKDINGYKSYANYQLEKMNYIISFNVINDENIEFEIEAETMQPFKFKLFYNDKLIDEKYTEEYIHYKIN